MGLNITIAFSILCQILIGIMYFATPENDSEAGEAVLILASLYGFMAVTMLLPSTLISWYKQPPNQRRRKRPLILALVIMEWIPIALICWLAGIYIQDQYSIYHDQWMLKHSSLVQMQETPVTLNGATVGVHLDLQIDMPPQWAKKYPHCTPVEIRLLAANLTDQLEMNNNHDTCEMSADKQTYHIHHAADYYPFTEMNLYWRNKNRICRQFYSGTYTPIATSYASFGFLRFDGLEVIKYPKDPMPAPIKTEILNHLHLMLDKDFWHQAQQNFTEENILALGFKKCEHSPRASAAPMLQCYCK